MAVTHMHARTHALLHMRAHTHKYPHICMYMPACMHSSFTTKDCHHISACRYVQPSHIYMGINRAIVRTSLLPHCPPNPLHCACPREKSP